MSKVRTLLAAVVVSALLLMGNGSRTSEADTQRWIVGLATTCADVTTWWHSNEGEFDTDALDLVLCNGATTSGNQVWYQDYGYYADLEVWFLNHDTAYTSCTGVQAEIYDEVNGWYLGGIHYVHINAAAGVIGDSFVSSNNWNLELVGTVAGSQPAGCPFPDGPHLHQSNRTEIWALHNNSSLNDDDPGNAQVEVNPTGSTSSNWLHALEQWW